MLEPTYLAFIRYFYCTCLTRPPDFLSRVRNLAGATQRIKIRAMIKIDKIESEVAPVDEAESFGFLLFWYDLHCPEAVGLFVVFTMILCETILTFGFSEILSSYSQVSFK